MDAAFQRFTGAAPESQGITAGRDLVNRTIAGDYVNQGNPYLQGLTDSISQNIGDQVFNQNQNRFAGAGRNVGGSDIQGHFRDDLTQAIAPTIAGVRSDNYNFERGNQIGGLNMVSQFDDLNTLISRLGPLSQSSQFRNTNQVGSSAGTGSTSQVNRDRASPMDIIGSFFG